MSPAITFTAKIYQQITKLFEKMETDTSSKSNTEKLIACAHFWDHVQSYAKKQSDAAWKALETEEVISLGKLTQGEHILAESPHFIVQANVSAPYKTFKPDVLAFNMKAKYKVPVPICVEMIEQAKLPGNPRVTLKTIER